MSKNVPRIPTRAEVEQEIYRAVLEGTYNEQPCSCGGTVAHAEMVARNAGIRLYGVENDTHKGIANDV